MEVGEVSGPQVCNLPGQVHSSVPGSDAGVLPDSNPSPPLWVMARQHRRTSLSAKVVVETCSPHGGPMRVYRASAPAPPPRPSLVV